MSISLPDSAGARERHRRWLLLVRHGETAFNREGRFQGHLDVPLSPEGMAQAEALGRRLASWPIVYCVSSDLSRARVTAEAIAVPHDLSVDLDPDLREANLGILQGRLGHEVSALLGDDAAYARRRIDARPPGGESPLEVRRRARRFARRLDARLTSLPPGAVVVVGHGGSLRALVAVLLDLPPAAGWAFRFVNCGLTVVEIDAEGHRTLVAHNDRCHLEPAAAEPGERREAPAVSRA